MELCLVHNNIGNCVTWSTGSVAAKPQKENCNRGDKEVLNDVIVNDKTYDYTFIAKTPCRLGITIVDYFTDLQSNFERI